MSLPHRSCESDTTVAPKFCGKFTRTTTSTAVDFSTTRHTIVEFETDDPALFEVEATRRGYAKAHASQVRALGSLSHYRSKDGNKLPTLTAVEKEWLGQPVELLTSGGLPYNSSQGVKGERGIVMGLAPTPAHVWVYMADRADTKGVSGADLWVCYHTRDLFKAGRSQRYPATLAESKLLEA